MTLRLAILVCLALPACGDWPESDGTLPNRGGWPDLMPVSQILHGDLQFATTVGEASAEEAELLSRRADRLRQRARVLRADASSDAAMEALRARMAAY